MTDEEIDARVRTFEEIFIEHPRIMAAEGAIHALTRRQVKIELPASDEYGDSSAHLFDFSEAAAPGEIRDDARTQYCALIVGETGAGKTRLLKRLVAQDRYREVLGGPDGDILPLLTFGMPNSPTPKSFLEILCETANVKIVRGMTRNELARQLRHKLAEIKTRLIIVDEAHVLVEDMTAKATTSLARCIKFLLNTCGVPFAFLGEGPLKELSTYPALKRRIDACICIEGYSWSFADDNYEFLRFLDQLDEGLGFAKRSGLSDLELASRLFFVSQGHIGQVAKYLSKALERALSEGAKRVTEHHLARAHAEWNIVHKPVANDPDVFIDGTEVTLNPFLVEREQFKALWAAKFTETVVADNSPIVARERKPRTPRTSFSK